MHADVCHPQAPDVSLKSAWRAVQLKSVKSVRKVTLPLATDFLLTSLYYSLLTSLTVY